MCGSGTAQVTQVIIFVYVPNYHAQNAALSVFPFMSHMQYTETIL